MKAQAVRAVAAACLAALARTTPCAGESGPCQLMVSSRPKGATVFVDGKERGRTPLMVKGLSSGAHRLRVVLDGHRAWTKTVRLRPGPRIVSAELKELGTDTPDATTDQPAPRGGRARVRGPTDVSPVSVPDSTGETGKGKDKKDGPPRRVDVECPCCRGGGLIKEVGCAHCGAIGYAKASLCGHCQGKARIEYGCHGCEGTGKITRPGKEADCALCRGKGAPPCPVCRGKGKVSRPNPEAASYETTPCISCDGDGYEKHLRCRKCTGRGKLTQSGPGSRPGFVRTGELVCPFCGGDGKAPEICRRCDGRGSFGPRGPQRIVTPCMSCGGTGHRFLPCKTCRGNGWHRSR